MLKILILINLKQVYQGAKNQDNYVQIWSACCSAPTIMPQCDVNFVLGSYALKSYAMMNVKSCRGVKPVLVLTISPESYL